MDLDALLAAAGIDRAAPPFDSESGRGVLAVIGKGFASSGDPQARRRMVLEQIGLASSAEVRQVLARLREALDAQILSEFASRIDAAFGRSEDAGWRAWLQGVASLVAEFRLLAAQGLASRPFPFEDSRRPEVDRIQRAAGLMRQARWEEVYPEVELLASQEFITGLVRARLLMIQGQIQHYRFGDTTAARALLEQAAELAPDDGVIQSALGEPWLDEGGQEQANACFDHAIAIAPDVVNGYVGRGDSALRADDVAEAERWYRRAVEIAPGESSGHARLQSLFGRSERLKEHERELVDALERRIALDPDDEYSAYLDAGTSFLESKDHARAEEWYGRATALEPRWVRAYLSLADLRRRQQRPEEAIEFCHKAIEVAPDCADGYVSLSDTYVAAKQGAKAVAAYQAIPESVRRSGTFLRKGGSFRNGFGNVYYSLGDFESAAREYEQAVRESPHEAAYHRNLAYALQQADEYAKAEAAFQRAFEADGDRQQLESSLANLANEQGNAAYSAGRYREAIEHYQRAIELRPLEPVFHGNLAGAWELLSPAGERAAALARAIASYEEADRLSTRPERGDKIERLRNRLEVARACGDRALDRVCLVTPIAVEVAADVIPLVEGEVEGTLSEPVKRLVEEMRSRVLDECGVGVPGIRFRGNEGDLAPGSYVILLNEVPLVLGQVYRDRMFASGAREELSKLSRHEPSADPVTGSEGLWLAESEARREPSAPLQLWQPMEYLMRHVEKVLRKNLAELVGHEEVQALLERHPSGATEAIRKSPGSLTALTTVCRALLSEEVPIRPFEPVCEIFAREAAEGAPLRDVVERIRGSAGIRERLPGNESGRRILALGPNLEGEIRRALYTRGGHTVLAMEPELCQEALAAVRVEAGAGPEVLVVRDGELRPYLRKLVEIEFPELPVLSSAERVADLESAAKATVDIARRAVSEGRSARVSRGAGPPELERGWIGEGFPDIVVATSREFPDQASLGDEQPIEGLLSEMQDALFYELGVTLPTVWRDDDDPHLAPSEFRLRIDGVDHGTRSGLEPQEFLVDDIPERLQLLGIRGAKVANPATGAEASKVRETGKELEACRQAGLKTWGPAGFVVLALSAELRKTAARFQTDAVTRFDLGALRAAFPVLVDRALERYPLPRIAGVLRAALEEEVSIRDLRGILESLLALNGTTDADGSQYILFTTNADHLLPSATIGDPDQLGVAQLADFVRTRLKRYISHKYSRGRSTLVVLLLDPEIEKRLGRAGSEPLSPEERERLLAAVDAEWKDSRAASPVLLTTLEIRRSLRNLLRPRFPDLEVVAYEELSPELNIQPIARISTE